ncbi:MAG: pilus assembly protein TadG-related protein [Terriglobales bacterium]|jgi:hypothetical protein
MRRRKNLSERKNEQGIIITLVAVFMLFVVGAMAALSIDVVTLYTARSEAQLAADGAALAGARVLANSGMTSDTNAVTDGLATHAETLARAVATQVAANNQVGGRNLNPGGPCAVGTEISVCFNDGATAFATNPHVTVTVQRTDLPTFFARIWGTKQVTVGASATAEAYNPSGASGTPPVAPVCVKPWLLPNIDPSNTAAKGSPIFNPVTGAIQTTSLLGSTSSTTGTPLQPACINCTPLPAPAVTGWQYYPGDTTTTFPPPQALPNCAPAMTTAYEQSIAGCIQTPIACNSNTAYIDTINYAARNRETAHAVNCLTHSNTNQGDQVDPADASPPFQFLAGNDNPITGLAGSDVMVSDSLVTVPVFDVGAPIGPGPTFNPPTSPVQIVGFVQLFLNPNGLRTRPWGPTPGQVNTTVINMAGCGTGASGTPILGNGASPVAVRLISPP